MMSKMHALFSTVVAPLIDACRPGSVVEVSGEHNLGELLDVAVQRQGGEVHRAGPSRLLELPAPDLALVHGQPNWHSVTEALEGLDEAARTASASLAITVVHGVDWPTARRDAYPDPAAVPVGARQPHAPDGELERALDEHDRQNGVLTAVEDFIGDRSDIELVHVPGLGGVAILCSARRLEEGGPLRELCEGLRLGPPALAQVAAIEADRARLQFAIEELSAELEGARAGVTVQESAERATLRKRLESLAARIAELQEELARRDGRISQLWPSGEDGAGAPAASPGRAAATQAAVTTESLPDPLQWRATLRDGGAESVAGEDPIETIVTVGDDPERLRVCLWSLLSRAPLPINLTLVGGGGDALSLARQLRVAEPLIRLAENRAQSSREAWSLRIEEPVTLGHGTLATLLAAAHDSPAPVAASRADALGLPSWAGPESLGLLFGPRTLGSEDASGLASGCVLARPGADLSAAPLVCLGAAVAVGADPRSRAAEESPLLEGAFKAEEVLADRLRQSLASPLAIAYVLPGLPVEGSGGSHSIFQEAQALRSIGAAVRVLVEAEHAERAVALYPQAAEIVQPYGSADAFAAGLHGFDVVVATEAPSVALVRDHLDRSGRVLGAYYAQDYEPLFSPPGGPAHDAALLSYRQAEGMLLYAKTHWLANVVASAHGIPVTKVSPSLDRSLFHPRGRRRESEPLRFLAMVRPRTPRRRPAETLLALARIKAALGDRAECLSFGCSVDELESLGPTPGVDHLGVLTREEVAEVLRRCDIFLDLSSYQAFGRTGLEAMACGAVPLLPHLGGTHEFAIHERNAMLVDTYDGQAVVRVAMQLAGDPALLERLRTRGIEDVRQFSPLRAAVSQYTCFASGRRQVLGSQ